MRHREPGSRESICREICLHWPATGSGAAIDLEQAYAETLPFGDTAFDVVVSTNVFHFIQHPVAALREMFRVSKPSGRVVITDWCDDYLACQVCDMFLRAFSRAHFRTYGSKECRELFMEAGFASVDIERYRINWLWGLMTATATKDAVQPIRKPITNKD